MNYDIISRVLEFCSHDYILLSHCALVNSQFNLAASKLLYCFVTISPKFNPQAVLNLRDPGAIPKGSNFTSACLPRYAPFVRVLEASGHISPRPPPRNTLSEKIATALPTFTNLTSVIFTPVTYHDDLFAPSILILHNLAYLTELTVNASCTDDDHAPAIVQTTRLRKLSLKSPGRTILNLLPEWLSRLSPNLIELHLQDNCGSVTPGVLKAILPHVEHTLEAFTLGLSYSLTNDDVYTFLDHLPYLRRLQLRYYWQLRPPKHQPTLSGLRSFSATYLAMHTRKEVDDFDKWVRRAISRSPALSVLSLLCEADEDDRVTYISHDALADHLVKKHADTLRVLDFSNAFLGVEALKEVLRACTRLEVLAIQSGKESLDVLLTHVSSIKSRLRSISLNICNAPRNHQVDQVIIDDILRKGQPTLRRLAVDDTVWEATWFTSTEGQTSLIVQQAEDQTCSKM